MADYMNSNQNAGMDWNDAIENDGQEFIILSEGDYNFTVTGFERGRFPGSAKMSACNKASLTLQVQTDDGTAIVHTDLILNRLLECTTHKKNNCPVCDTGIIREDVLKEECAKVLGTLEFDEEVFSERVKQITIPEAGTMLFEFTNGTTLEHHWERNAKKESWTPECRKRASDYRKTHPATRDDITCFTTKIRCEHCGCNYRKQSQTMADGSRNAYWRCADRNGCTVKGLRDDHMREIAAEVLGMETFDENVFLQRVDHIGVRYGTHLTFHFTDGTTIEREYKYRKEGRTWSDEHKERMSRIMKSKVTLESREAASRRMKQIRSEKKW